MSISLRQALRLAVGPANVDAAGHAVADWFDGRNRSGAADLIREQLQDQPVPDAVPHNRPDTSLRSELLHKLATQREVILDLCKRVDRLEMRADGLTPIERVQRRWAKESAGGDKLDRLIAQDKEADGPAVPEGREPAAVAEEPTDAELRDIWETGHLPSSEELANDDGEQDLQFLFTSAYHRWLEENPDAREEHENKCIRAVFNAGRRWGHQPAPPAEGEVGELMVSLRRASDGASAMGWEQDARTIARAADLLDRLASPACVVLKPSPELIEAFEGLPPGRIEPLPDNAQVIEPSNRTILVPAPVPVPVSERLPVDVEQALIKAECALSDIAEGEPEENAGDSDDLLQWAEQRAATALSRIRPVMRGHGILTSEWPPLPATAMPLPAGEA